MDVDVNVYLAYQRAKAKAVAARADAALARLGGETASHSGDDLTAGLTADEIERDAASIRNILSVWQRIGYRPRGQATINLPSGRKLVKDGAANMPGQREYSIGRPLRHRKKRR